MGTRYREYRRKKHLEKFGHKNKGRFEYFNYAWFLKHQLTLIWLLNAPIIKYWFRWILCIHKDTKGSDIIFSLEPNNYKILLPSGEFKADFRTHAKFAKRIYFAFRWWWYLLHYLDVYFINHIEPEYNFGFDTLTAYPDAHTEVDTVDGVYAYGVVNQSWSTLRSGAGNSATDNSVNGSAWRYTCGTSLYNTIGRGCFLFKTSALTNNVNISNAILYLYYQSRSDGNSDAPTLYITASNPTSNTALANGDYARHLTAATNYFSSMTYANFNSGYESFTLDSNGIANIDKTGISKFGSMYKKDYDNTDPTWVNSGNTYNGCIFADTSGTSTDPKLEITYTILWAEKFIQTAGTSMAKAMSVAKANIKKIMSI